MTTLADLLSVLGGIVEPADVKANLAAPMDASTTSLTVANSAEPLNAGDLLEVDNELLRATATSRVAGGTDTITVVRGVNGSTAAAHSAGATVAVGPLYPRFRRIQAINLAWTDWVTTRAPMVLIDTSQVFSATSNILTVPAGTIDVLRVEQQIPGYTILDRIRTGRPRPYPVALAATGFGVPLVGDVGWTAGYTAYTTYTAPWGPALAADADTLPASWVFGTELLAQGAAAFLLGGKFAKRGTYDEAQAQRAEQRAGQNLTAAAAQQALARFGELLAQHVQTWPGSRSPVYVEC